MGYSVQQHDCVHSFLQLVRPALEMYEVAHNLPLGILLSWEKGYSSLAEEPWLWTVHSEDQQLQWVLLRTPPHYMILCRAYDQPQAWRDQDEQALQAVIDALWASGHTQIPGVIGLQPGVDHFAALWCQQRPLEYEVDMRQRIYELRQLRDLSQTPPGQMLQASGSFIPLLTQWLEEFCLEAMPNEPTSIDYPKTVVRLLDEGKLYLWMVDGEPQAMAATSRPTRHGIVIADVYTPKTLRGKGYASALVHDLSGLFLEHYDFCSLYTDLANPTSNSIYQKIGYEPRYDSAVYRFTASE